MDFIITLIAIVAVFVAFIAGWLFHASYIMKIFAEKPDELINQLEKYQRSNNNVQNSLPELQPSSRELRVESEQGIFFLYAADNNQFLAQGSSIEEALEKLQQRFPNNDFHGTISKQDAEKLGLSKH